MVWEYENAIAESFDGERFNFAFDALFNNQVSLFVDNDKYYYLVFCNVVIF